MKEFFPRLTGNRPLRTRIGQSVTSGNTLHAYCVVGEDGSGKMTFAKNFAAALCCENRNDDAHPLPCGECRICRHILETGCPDVTVIDSGDNATISVEQIRSMRSDAYLASCEADKKVYIIDGAERMTVQAQNALLKLLEEPPQDVVILLLCENESLLLSTVRSRSQTIRMQKLSDDEVKEHLLRVSPEARRMSNDNPSAFSLLIAGANGSIGTAMNLLQPKSLSEYSNRRELADRLIAALLPRATGTALYEACSAFSTKRKDLSDEFSVVRSALRDLIALRRSPDVHLIYYVDRDAATELAQSIRLRTLVNAYDAVARAAISVQSNANISLSLAGLAADIRQ